MRWNFFLPWRSVANLKVDFSMENKKITFYAMEKFFLALALYCQPESRTSQWRTKKLRSMRWKSFFWPSHSFPNMKVWRTKKNYVLCDGKGFFLSMALCCQPESRTSQRRTKKLRSMQWKSYFLPWHSLANLKVELLNGAQKKLRSMRWKSFVLPLLSFLPT